MNRITPIFLATLLGLAGHALAQEKVDIKGITPKIKIEEVVYGHLAEINGKYKLRATEVTFAPGAYIGPHHHIGPGIRFVVSGQLAFTEVGKTIIYKAGDYFYETGNVVHTAQNRTKSPVRVIFFEILPGKAEGPTVIVPKVF